MQQRDEFDDVVSMRGESIIDNLTQRNLIDLKELIQKEVQKKQASGGSGGGKSKTHSQPRTLNQSNSNSNMQSSYHRGDDIGFA